jgi:hypothetical protein
VPGEHTTRGAATAAEYAAVGGDCCHCVLGTCWHHVTVCLRHIPVAGRGALGLRMCCSITDSKHRRLLGAMVCWGSWTCCGAGGFA